MRLGGLLLVAAVVVSGLFCGAMAISSYFEVSNIVEKAVEERGLTSAGPVREAIIRGATESGVRIDDRNVVVSHDDRALSVRLRWSLAVITYKYKGKDLLVIPLSLERTFATAR